LIDGHEVAADERIVLLLGSGNRDPDRFADPDLNGQGVKGSPGVSV